MSGWEPFVHFSSFNTHKKVPPSPPPAQTTPTSQTDFQSTSNESKVAVVAQLMKEHPHTSVHKKCKAFSFVWNNSENSWQELHCLKLAAKWVSYDMINKMLCKCCTQPFWARWSQACDGCHCRRQDLGTILRHFQQMQEQSMAGTNDLRHQICWPKCLSRKRMFTIFFNHQGSVVGDILPAKVTLCRNCLAQNHI